MRSGIDMDFKRFIDECDEEQDLNLNEQEQWEIDLNKHVDETYFKFTVPSILDIKQQKG